MTLKEIKNWFTYTDSVQVYINDDIFNVDVPTKLTGIIKRTYNNNSEDGTFKLYCETCDKVADIIRKKTHTNFRQYFVYKSNSKIEVKVKGTLFDE